MKLKDLPAPKKSDEIGSWIDLLQDEIVKIKSAIKLVTFRDLLIKLQKGQGIDLELSTDDTDVKILKKKIVNIANRSDIQLTDANRTKLRCMGISL